LAEPGLYISAIVEGYELVDVPPNDQLRAQLECLPLAQLVERLERVRPGRRQPHRSKQPAPTHTGNRSRLRWPLALGSPEKLPRYHCLQLGLTWPREILEARIEKRLRERLATGMVDEVAGLRSRGVPDIRLEKLGLEYRYITRYLRGELGTLEDLRLQLGTAIRQFAKGQVTWFKRDKRIIWLDPFRNYFQEACDRIREWEGKPPSAP